MDWIEASVIVDAEGAEAGAEALHPFSTGGVAIEQIGGRLPGEIESWAGSEGSAEAYAVRVYLPEDERLAETQRRLEEVLWHLGQIYPVPPADYRTVKEEDWAEAWKANYQVLRLGQRLVIRPEWREFEPLPGDVVLTLDPGMAFGTGLHPTTQMCLLALEERLQPGNTVLDLGTGSGILAIAAARLGATAVLAMDIDPIAVQAATANVARNGVKSVVTVAEGSLASLQRQPEQTWDVVVVNILARVIIDLLMHGLQSTIRPGGWMVLSGLIADQVIEVELALTATGGKVIARQQIKDWVALICQ